MVPRRGGVLLRPMKITSAVPDSMGRAEPCPYGSTIIFVYDHAEYFPPKQNPPLSQAGLCPSRTT